MAEVLEQGALDALLEMVGDDPGFVDQLADAYLTGVPVQMSELRAALMAAEPERLVRPAHTLKGASLSLGGAHVAELARAIEERGRSGSLDGIPGLLAELETAQHDLAGALALARSRRWTGE